RQRKLYINNTGKGAKWSHVVFEHPATFETLAMDPKEKQAIINDLMKFSKGKDYYKKIGKAWKRGYLLYGPPGTGKSTMISAMSNLMNYDRGYLLYGPPGTGKSTMISAMSNLMNYDVYDLELTAVKDNTELRKLLIDITGKAIIVIEDIDCSLDLTGQRKKKKQEGEKDGDEKDPIPKKPEEEETTTSKVTLSGLLNFIDGIWSACGGERLIVFTTNHVDKLDPALIRRGRMDKHIQLSYCCFGAFKVLARNYLDVESHELFGTIERLLGETDMTPADVAENLMLKSDTEDADSCLKSLIEALEAAKVEARVKAEEEARKKAEEEAKLKAEKEEKEKAKSGNSKDEVKCNGTKDEVKGTSVAEVKENGVTPPEEEEATTSKVTLSGLLNFIDGIWSACGGERLIVFTTNYVDKLDPALIRRGRMDKHIQLSYCCFEAFKVLARNYLDVESHELFGTIERLLGETDMTPADVAENLMPKSDTEDADSCLKSLIEALEVAKVEARVKAEEEASKKAEEEAKLKAEKEKEKSANGKDGVTCNGTKDELKGTSVAEVKENGVTP
ncbi:unnamed protein product, partial [Prunus brigantina]